VSLRGKRIVITGASAGIGAELARQLAHAGCRLVLAARRQERLDQVAADCRATGVEVHTVMCDVVLPAQLQALVRLARHELGEIDVWINNAGSGMRHRILEARDADMLALYHLHVLAPLHAYQLVAPGWIAARHPGQFVDICSVGGKAGYPFNAGYAAAKHALSAIGDVARLELAPHGIAVTTVYPGVTVSDFSQASVDRTDGASASFVSSSRASRSVLRRLVSRPQPTEDAVRRIVRGIERRSPTVYPHRWGLLAAALWHVAPGYVTRAVGRGLSSGGTAPK
jgi:short-subunit dehydrogenase